MADCRGTFYAFCNDRRGTLSDAAGEVFLCFARKKPGEDWETPRPLVAVEGWACSMGSAVYDRTSDTVMCCGEKIPVQIHDITGTDITFDMNHPLAGKDLTFEVEILSVVEPPEGWEPPAKLDSNAYVDQLM